uniref:protein-tyrosine-phosphatase n=1 Tax=Meloidogyne enterolobii TaxID=390850 RepID=A0A6V7VSL7_MELEN|nr:unnamed protein product [Meloidogyne enterolobii]
MINKILDCIFIGDIFSNDEINIEKFKIQTVLTLSSQPLALEKRIIGVNYQFIYMLDVENQNIFSSNILQKTFNLLQKCLENNQSILVHCESGISRSVTIIIAFLMKQNNWSYLNSFNFLKEKHSIAKPNNSFIKQLELFEKIGFITDPINLKKSEIFRDFVASNGYLFELNDNTSKYNLEESYLLSSKKFSCKKCRKILFFDFNVLKHFSDNKNIFCEFGYLITPMVWMELDELKGKVFFNY